MKNIILVYLFIFIHLFAEEIQLKEADGKYYYKNELYTGEKSEQKENRETIYETVSIYSRGELVEETKLVYDKEYIGNTFKEVKGILLSIRKKDFQKKKIDTTNYYLDGSLKSEGAYDFKFDKIGIWNYYTKGDLLVKAVDYDLGRKNNEGKSFTDKYDDSHIKEINYPDESIIKDIDGNALEIGKEFTLDNFSGSFEIFTNGKLTFKLVYDQGMIMESYSYFYNGQISYEKKLELKKGFFGKKWVGVEKNYYYNGNIKMEQGLSQKWKNTSSLDLLKDSLDFNPSKMKTLSSGRYVSYSYRYPFKQYYDNGQLMVEGDNYTENKIEDLKVYDREGNLIDFSSVDK